MAGYTSFGTRKALGKRYGQDPALLLEAERLRQEYGLMPGREARAMQASQFDKTMAENQSARDQSADTAAKAGMMTTGGNVIMGAPMAYMGYKAMFPNAPTISQALPMGMRESMPAFMGGPTAPTSAVPYSPGMTTPTGPVVNSVNPATIDATTASIAPSAASGSGGMTTANGAVMGSAEEGFAASGTGAGMSAYAPPVAAGAIGGKVGSYLMDKTNTNEWLQERTGIGGKKDWNVLGGVAGGAAAGAAIGSVVPGVGTVVGGAIGGVVGGAAEIISNVFGW